MIPVNVFGRRLCQPAPPPRETERLMQRFRDQTNPENRPSGFVLKLPLPFAVFLEFAGNAADHIAANASFHGASRSASSVPRSASDAEERGRHGIKPIRKGRRRSLRIQGYWIPQLQGDRFRNFTDLSPVPVFSATVQTLDLLAKC